MRRTGSILLLLAGAVAPAAAEGWQNEVTPYVWAAGQEGDTGQRDTRRGDLIASYDLSPGDVIDRLDSAVLLAYRGERNGTWGVMADALYIGLEDSGSLRSFDVDVEAAQLLLSAAYTRAFRKDSPWWWYAGVRYVDMDNKILFHGNGPIGIGGSIEPGATWFDPYLGLQYRRRLGERWSIGVLAEAGGFGVGSDSTWQSIVEAGVDLSGLLRLRFGYRWMDLDYDDDDFEFDATTQGAIIGLTFHW